MFNQQQVLQQFIHHPLFVHKKQILCQKRVQFCVQTDSKNFRSCKLDLKIVLTNQEYVFVSLRWPREIQELKA